MSFAAFQNQFAVDWQAMDGMPPTTDGYYSHTHASYLTGSCGDVTYTDAPCSTHGDISPSSTTSSSVWCSSENGPVFNTYDQSNHSSMSPVHDVYCAQSDNVNGPGSLRCGGANSLLLTPEPNYAEHSSTVDNMPFTPNASTGTYRQLVYSSDSFGNSANHISNVRVRENSEADIDILYPAYTGSIHAQAPSPGFGSYAPPQPVQLPPHSFIPSPCGSFVYTAPYNSTNDYPFPTSRAPPPLSPLSPSLLSPTPVSSTYKVEQASRPSAHAILIHTPSRNEQAPLSSEEISSVVESSQRCTVPGCDYSTWRKPDLRRHMESHCSDSCNKWVCCGIPLKEWLERCPPEEEVREADVCEYYGQEMVGGCWKKFGRKDALGRHLRRFGCMGHV